jgi:RND family efflux transporter MFP subunit
MIQKKSLFKIVITLFITINLNAKTIELSATVISDNEKLITSRFMGFVKKVNVNEGDIVKKGQLLYEIDSTDIDSKKQQALLGIQIYQNQYTNVKINYERYKRLFNKGLVSKFEVEQLELQYKNLSDMINISKARMNEVNNQYKYLKVKAPNDGVIIKKSIKYGEMAIPGMPALILSDISSLKIKTQIAENDLLFIFKNKEVNIEIPSLNLKSVGKIIAIIPSSNVMTHTFTIKIEFNQNDNVYPGMYAKVFINTNKKIDAK